MSSFSLLDLPVGFKSFLIKILLFLFLFIVVTGIVGQWIIGTKLLYGYYFFIYGNLGKMVLFSTIAFLLLTRSQLPNLHIYKQMRTSIFLIICAFLLLIPLSIESKQLLQTHSFSANIPFSLSVHLLLIIIPVLLFVGVFGIDFMKKFGTLFKNELLICLGIAVFFDISIFYVWRLWPLLSNLVLRILYMIFSHIYTIVKIFPPRTLFVQKFAVEIDEACSGIDSIYLFTSLYFFITFLDWRKLQHIKVLLLILPAVLGLFVVNVLRVFILILIGVYISPRLTLELFHTYIGMVLFICYFTIFWKLLYRWMVIKK